MYEGKQKTNTMLELQGDGSNLGKCKEMLLVYVKSSEVPLLWKAKLGLFVGPLQYCKYCYVYKQFGSVIYIFDGISE